MTGWVDQNMGMDPALKKYWAEEMGMAPWLKNELKSIWPGEQVLPGGNPGYWGGGAPLPGGRIGEFVPDTREGSGVSTRVPPNDSPYWDEATITYSNQYPPSTQDSKSNVNFNDSWWGPGGFFNNLGE